ncbi:hypothetical protein FSP39_008435 [Pinctada imbricata]|uniref:NADAR domain-containing protein n=1 Tax=Pinctada imbricata TaxID=66713 RepID=A0AA88YKP8_PINIB|nr:hypothetical protein FSP39_008435 [Pinctada imbricata]
MDDRTIKPLYLKNSDIQVCESKRITDYELMDYLSRCIGDSLHCLQLDRNLWRIYVKDRDSRNKLLNEGLDIQNIAVSFYDTNPYSSGATDANQRPLKLRISGLPLSVDDSAIHELLIKLEVKLTSKILYEKIRHPVTNKMTSVLNGNRFMYIEPLPEGRSLPRVNNCAGLRCLLFHYGQPKVERKLLCTNCWKTDHTRSNCKNEPCCKVCKDPGHSPGDEKCPFYEHQKEITPFSGATDVLSNFFPCSMDLYGVQHKSAEHAFQYTKAVRCGDLNAANSIKDAKDALSAKRIGDKIKPNEQWISTKSKVMEEIVENKCVQVPMFKEKLRSAKRNTLFVETSHNDEWGSGLDREGTLYTKKNHWPGKNTLGSIIGKVADKVRKRKKSDQWSKPKQKQLSKETTNQRDIVKMLRDLRATSDSDSVTSGQNDDTEYDSSD